MVRMFVLRLFGLLIFTQDTRNSNFESYFYETSVSDIRVYHIIT